MANQKSGIIGSTWEYEEGYCSRRRLLTIEKTGELATGLDDGSNDFRWTCTFLVTNDNSELTMKASFDFYGQGNQRPTLSEVMGQFLAKIGGLAIGFAGTEERMTQ